MTDTTLERVRRLSNSLDSLVSSMEQSGNSEPLGAALRDVEAALAEARSALVATRRDRLDDFARSLPASGPVASAAAETHNREGRLEDAIAELHDLKGRMMADLAAFFAACRSHKGADPRKIEGHIARARDAAA